MDSCRRAVLGLLAYVGLVLAAAPLAADEGHCARPAQAPVAEVHAHGAAQPIVASTTDALSTDRDCPECPVRTCGSMHGCSAAHQVASELVTVRPAPMPIARVVPTYLEAAPASVSQAPPTPPPLVVLSPA